MLYVRGFLAKRYHWCANCPHYPTTVWNVTHQRPVDDELCQACLLRERRSDCSPVSGPATFV